MESSRLGDAVAAAVVVVVEYIAAAGWVFGGPYAVVVDVGDGKVAVVAAGEGTCWDDPLCRILALRPWWMG